MKLSDYYHDEVEFSKGLAFYVSALYLSLITALVLLILALIGVISGLQGSAGMVAVTAAALKLADMLARRFTGFHASCKKHDISPVEMVCDFAKSKLLSPL